MKQTNLQDNVTFVERHIHILKKPNWFGEAISQGYIISGALFTLSNILMIHSGIIFSFFLPTTFEENNGKLCAGWFFLQTKFVFLTRKF